jgi:hypothetical protein
MAQLNASDILYIYVLCDKLITDETGKHTQEFLVSRAI